MALIKCKECGKEISTQAASCPHCGAVRFVPKEKPKTSGCAWIALLFIGIPFLLVVFFSSSRTTTIPTAPRTNAPNAKADQATIDQLVEETKGQQWSVARGKSKKDDSPTVTISTPAQNFARNVLGLRTVPTLYVRCLENQTDVIVAIEGSYLNNEPIPVTTRLDKERAETVNWNVSTGHDAVLRFQPIPFARRLAKSETLWMQLTPYGQDPVEFTFVTYGLDKHIGALQSACGWK